MRPSLLVSTCPLRWDRSIAAPTAPTPRKRSPTSPPSRRTDNLSRWRPVMHNGRDTTRESVKRTPHHLAARCVPTQRTRPSAERGGESVACTCGHAKADGRSLRRLIAPEEGSVGEDDAAPVELHATTDVARLIAFDDARRHVHLTAGDEDAGTAIGPVVSDRRAHPIRQHVATVDGDRTRRSGGKRTAATIPATLPGMRSRLLEGALMEEQAAGVHFYSTPQCDVLEFDVRRAGQHAECAGRARLRLQHHAATLPRD
eukprot:3867571-Prymnesium_polylepis.1